MQLVAAPLPGASLKNKAGSRRFAREKAGSEGREQHRVIACKLNSACKWQQQRQALNQPVSCAWSSCRSPRLPSDTGEGMRTEGAFEIHTSKLISEWPGLYVLHDWRQVRERETRRVLPQPLKLG